MDTERQNQEEFTQNWYETAEYMLTNETNKLSNEEIDQLLAEATYNMTDEEAENFLRSLGGIVKKGIRVVAPIAQNLAPIIGTVAGAAIGGPVGASLGGALGGAISNIGRTPQQSPTNPPVQIQTRPTSPQRGIPRSVAPPAQVSPVNRIQPVPPPTTINQGSTSSHSPITNQLLMLINNPDFLMRLLQAVIPNNSRQRITTRPTEELIQDLNTIKFLSEAILNTTHLIDQQETIEETQNTYYYDDIETHCECSL